MTHEEDVWWQEVLNSTLTRVRQGEEPVEAIGQACLAYNIPEYFSEKYWDEWLTHATMYADHMKGNPDYAK